MGGMDNQGHLPAVAKLVRETRENMGLTLRDAAVLGDLGLSTWNAIEQARPVRERTYGRVERALKLEPGTLRTVRDTGLLAPPPPPPGAGVAHIARLIRLVDEAEDVPDADKAAITATMTAALAHMRERAAVHAGSTERQAG